MKRMFNAQCSIFNIQHMEMKNKYDLEDRLVEYSCRVMDVVEALPNTRAGNYIAGQLIKSCISPTFNYGKFRQPSQGMILYINLGLF